MSAFLQQQHVQNSNRRRKNIRRLFVRIQSISFVVLIWFLGVGIFYGFYHFVFEKGLFTVANVEIEGAFYHISKDDIKNAAGIQSGSNLFSVNLKKVQKKIADNPWVLEAAVTRKLPSTIWIYVSEHAPLALLASDSIYMVDINGTVFKEADNGEYKDLPAITGFSKADNIGGATEVLKSYLNSPLADYFRPSEVHYDDESGYSIVLSGDGTTIKLGVDGIQEKLDRFYSMLGAVNSYKNKMRYVDLGIPGKVVVKYDS
ncbi:MAG: FtsQ-type POTRA domain-containing protein [Deltaproteobacteria bacterium]|nr:FtsQ-type POTRA domain-containing protein [Deltaproteobacteria bacterium]